MSNRGTLLLAALTALPLGLPFGAPLVGPERLAAQERALVSNQIAISGRDASLTLEFSDGGETVLSFRDGSVMVDGNVIGTYAAGDALAASWRGLLGEAASLSNGPLERALAAWAPPTGLSDDATTTGRALDQALEAALSGAVASVATGEGPTAQAVTAPAAAGSGAAVESVDRVPAAPQAPTPSFQSSNLDVGTLLRSPRLLQVIGAFDDLDVDLDDVHAFIGQDVEIDAGESVDGVLLVVDGDLDIRGDVDGDVILAGGRVRLHEGGMIDGDVHLVDGRFDDRGGELYGSTTRLGSGSSYELNELRSELRDEIRRELEEQFEGAYSSRTRSIFSPFRHIWKGVAGIFQNLLTFGILSALGALALYFWPGRVDVVANTAKESLPKAAMVGMAGAFLFVPVWVIGCVALAISIIGIPALLAWVPLFPIAGGLAALFGFLSVAMLVGDWAQEKGVRGFEWIDGSSPLMRMVGGIFAVTLLAVATNVLRMGGPLLGFFHGLMSFVAGLTLLGMISVGFGAVLLSRGGRRTYTEGDFMDQDWSWRSWTTPSEAAAAASAGVEDVVSEVVDLADDVAGTAADAAETAAEAAQEVVDDVVDAAEGAAEDATGSDEGPEKADA